MIVLIFQSIQITLNEHSPFVLLGTALISALPNTVMQGRHTHRAPKAGGLGAHWREQVTRGKNHLSLHFSVRKLYIKQAHFFQKKQALRLGSSCVIVGCSKYYARSASPACASQKRKPCEWDEKDDEEEIAWNKMSEKCLHLTLALSELVKLMEFAEESLNEVIVAGIMFNKSRTETYSGRVEQGNLHFPHKDFVEYSAIQIYYQRPWET